MRVRACALTMLCLCQGCPCTRLPVSRDSFAPSSWVSYSERLSQRQQDPLGFPTPSALLSGSTLASPWRGPTAAQRGTVAEQGEGLRQQLTQRVAGLSRSQRT